MELFRISHLNSSYCKSSCPNLVTCLCLICFIQRPTSPQTHYWVPISQALWVEALPQLLTTSPEPPESWWGRGLFLPLSASLCISSSPLSTSSTAQKCPDIMWLDHPTSLWQYPCQRCVRLYGPRLHLGSIALPVPSHFCTPSTDPHPTELPQCCLYRASCHIQPMERTSWPSRWHSWRSHPMYLDLLA